VAFQSGSESEEIRIRERSALLASTALAEVLTELFDLLEQYAPSWYTQEHHDKALAALQMLKESERSKGGQPVRRGQS